MEKLDVYRISDPLFRIHSRLFKVQEAVLRSSRVNVESSKLGVFSRAGIFTALVLFIVTLLVQILKVEVTSTPIKVIALIFLLGILAFVFEYVGLRRTAKEFDRLIADSGGDRVDTWPDFASAVIAGYGTRLKLTTEMQEELQKAYDGGHISVQRYDERRKHYEAIRTYCVDGLAQLRLLNEELLANRKRTQEEYTDVKHFLEHATIGLRSEEIERVGRTTEHAPKTS